MSRSAPSRSWQLLALAVLMVAPAPLVSAALIAAATGAIAIRSRLRAWRRAAPSVPRADAAATVLGVDHRRRPVRVSDRELSAHGLILGASGAGKSTTLLRILTDQVLRGRPVIAIDLKGSPAFAADLAHAVAAAGRRLQVWTLDGPAHWNPLQHGNPTELKDKLIATERFTEPHYRRAAERYAQTVLQVLEQAHAGQAPTLQEVVALMEPRRLRAVARGLEQTLADRVQDYLTGLTADQLSAIRGLQTRLAIVTESHTGAYLSPAADAAGRSSSIDLRASLAGGEVVLFSLNSSTYGQLAAQVGTLVIQDLVSATGHRLAAGRRGAPVQATIGIDEFSALGADHVVALLSRGRESGVSVLLATQELADLDRAAPGLRDQVLGVTAIKIAHRQEVPRSAETIAQIAGTEKAWVQTRQIAGGLLGDYDTGRGTRRQVDRYRVDPNVIKTLPAGHAVMISKLRRAPARTVRVFPPRREVARGTGPARPPRRDGPAPPTRRDGPAR